MAKIEAFGPQLIMLSSGTLYYAFYLSDITLNFFIIIINFTYLCLKKGFDGHKSDPTEGGMRLTQAEYRFMTDLLKDAAFKYCGGKMISVLEGGYHIPSLRKCIEEHLTVLADN